MKSSSQYLYHSRIMFGNSAPSVAVIGPNIRPHSHHMRCFHLPMVIWTTSVPPGTPYGPPCCLSISGQRKVLGSPHGYSITLGPPHGYSNHCYRFLIWATSAVPDSVTPKLPQKRAYVQAAKACFTGKKSRLKSSLTKQNHKKSMKKHIQCRKNISNTLLVVS